MRVSLQVNFLLCDDHEGGRFHCILVGEAEVVSAAIERIYMKGGTPVKIEFCDISQIPPASAWWDSPVLMPLRAKVLGSVGSDGSRDDYLGPDAAGGALFEFI